MTIGPNKMKNLLITLADKNYIDQAKQLFSSVYFNAGWKGDYMLLAHQIPEKELKWFREKGILIKKCKPLYNKKMARFPPTVLSKFYLFTPEFKKWKNIVYLDGDIIVRASLDKLTKVKGFGAVIDKNIFKVDLEMQFKKINKNIWNKLKQNYKLKNSTFNSGVMCFNTKIIKENTFFELISLFREYQRIDPLGDQPIFNLYFKKWQKLPEVYNIFIHPKIWKDHEFKNIKGIILHFYHFPYKPWKSTNFFHQEWKNNLDKSELINLSKVGFPIKRWNKYKIHKHSLFLRKKYFMDRMLDRPKKFFHHSKKFLNSPKKIFDSIKKFPIEILHNIDRFIGLVGIFLKKYSPKLYFKLKKLKEKNLLI